MSLLHWHNFFFFVHLQQNSIPPFVSNPFIFYTINHQIIGYHYKIKNHTYLIFVNYLYIVFGYIKMCNVYKLLANIIIIIVGRDVKKSTRKLDDKMKLQVLCKKLFFFFFVSVFWRYSVSTVYGLTMSHSQYILYSSFFLLFLVVHFLLRSP